MSRALLASIVFTFGIWTAQAWAADSTVAGTVHDTLGRPVAGAAVVLQSGDGHEVAHATADFGRRFFVPRHRGRHLRDRRHAEGFRVGDRDRDGRCCQCRCGRSGLASLRRSRYGRDRETARRGPQSAFARDRVQHLRGQQRRRRGHAARIGYVLQPCASADPGRRPGFIWAGPLARRARQYPVPDQRHSAARGHHRVRPGARYAHRGQRRAARRRIAGTIRLSHVGRRRHHDQERRLHRRWRR